MPDRDQIRSIVQSDVETAFAGSFPPAGANGGFRLLHIDDVFTFAPPDIPNDAGVTAVPWQYVAIHERPLLASAGTDYSGAERAVIDGHPIAHQPHSGAQAPGLPATNRPVTIAGVTLVVTRPPGHVDRPMLLRFIDWADVFTQLGFGLQTRGPNPDEEMPGFQHLEDAIRHAGGG